MYARVRAYSNETAARGARRAGGARRGGAGKKRKKKLTRVGKK